MNYSHDIILLWYYCINQSIIAPNSVGAPSASEKDGSGSNGSSSVSTSDIKLDTKAQKISRLSTKSNKKQTVETEVEAETPQISSSSSSSSANTNSLLDSKAQKISNASSNEVVADSIEQGTTTTTSTADPTTSSSATAVATTTTAVTAKSTEGKRLLDSLVAPLFSFLMLLLHICAFILD